MALVSWFVEFVPVTWQVRAGAAPCALRDCPRCNARRRFLSSGRFRTNASGRRLDVWLIYRCEACDFTWNRTVHERASPSDLGALLERYQNSDPALAAEIADDAAGLARAGGVVDSGDAVVVERPALADDAGLDITLAVGAGCVARLDRLLASELGVSRSRLSAWHERGLLTIEPGAERALRKPARDGQRIRISAGAMAER